MYKFYAICTYFKFFMPLALRKKTTRNSCIESEGNVNLTARLWNIRYYDVRVEEFYTHVQTLTSTLLFCEIASNCSAFGGFSKRICTCTCIFIKVLNNET